MPIPNVVAVCDNVASGGYESCAYWPLGGQRSGSYLSGTFTIDRFDKDGVKATFGNANGSMTNTYTGKFEGKLIRGTAVHIIKSGSFKNSSETKWIGVVVSIPSGDPSADVKGTGLPMLRLLSMCETYDNGEPDACFLWNFPDQHRALNLSLDHPGTLVVTRYDSKNLEFTETGLGGQVASYSGTRSGSLFRGSVNRTGAGRSNGKWTASMIGAPDGDFNKGHNIYVACDGDSKVGIVNDANHFAKTLELEGIVNGIVVSPDGTNAYVSTTDRKVYVIDEASDEVSRTFDLQKSSVSHGFLNLAISADGSALYGNAIEYLSGQSQPLVGSLNTASGEVNTMPGLFVPDEMAVLAMGSKFYIFWRNENDRERDLNLADLKRSTPVAAASDSRGLSAFRDGKRIFVWGRVFDTANQKLSDKQFQGENGAVFSPDGKKAYVSDGDCCVLVYRLDGQSKASLIRKIPVGAALRVIAIAPDGSTVYVGGTNGVVSISTAVDLATDQIGVCANALFIGVRPLAPGPN